VFIKECLLPGLRRHPRNCDAMACRVTWAAAAATSSDGESSGGIGRRPGCRGEPLWPPKAVMASLELRELGFSSF